MEEVMSSSLQGFVVKRIWIHGDHECKMKVWESPFIPSHLTFKKFRTSLTFRRSINQSIKSIYLFITFQNLEFWDVTIINKLPWGKYIILWKLKKRVSHKLGGVRISHRHYIYVHTLMLVVGAHTFSLYYPC